MFLPLSLQGPRVPQFHRRPHGQVPNSRRGRQSMCRLWRSRTHHCQLSQTRRGAEATNRGSPEGRWWRWILAWTFINATGDKIRVHVNHHLSFMISCMLYTKSFVAVIRWTWIQCPLLPRRFQTLSKLMMRSKPALSSSSNVFLTVESKSSTPIVEPSERERSGSTISDCEEASQAEEQGDSNAH